MASLYRQMSGTTPYVVEEDNKVAAILDNTPQEVKVDVDSKKKKKENETNTVNEKLYPIFIPKVLPPIEPKETVSPAPSYSSFEPPSYQDLHPFAPTPTGLSSPVPNEDQEVPKGPDAEDNQSAPLVDPNWFPGLPRPPPGIYVQPPRNRSKVERIRYLADFQRLNFVVACKAY